LSGNDDLPARACALAILGLVPAKIMKLKLVAAISALTIPVLTHAQQAASCWFGSY
jgi:hypothetical protein